MGAMVRMAMAIVLYFLEMTLLMKEYEYNFGGKLFSCPDRIVQHVHRNQYEKCNLLMHLNMKISGANDRPFFLHPFQYMRPPYKNGKSYPHI
jgi:hypothetical protein